LIHTMPPNTDRPINRAMVVGCAVSATRNHLKLHEPRKLKVLLSNIHAKTRKLWKHAMRLAASRTNAAHQFTNRPLMNSVCRRVISDRPSAPWSLSDDRNPLTADMISLRRPVSRRVNRTGSGDDPKLVAEVTLAGT
jgi:hypothetical protein